MNRLFYACFLLGHLFYVRIEVERIVPEHDAPCPLLFIDTWMVAGRP